jgi:hypothetical protein
MAQNVTMKHLVDMNTGECIDRLLERGKLLPDSRRLKLIGSSLPFPYNCKSPEELNTTLKVLDPYYKRTGSLHVRHFAMSQSIIEGILTPSEAKVMLYYCSSVSGWNIWFGHSDRVLKDIDLPRASFYKASKKLTSLGYLRKHHNTRDHDSLLIHPWFSWKGDLQHRDSMVTSWYTNLHR